MTRLPHLLILLLLTAIPLAGQSRAKPKPSNPKRPFYHPKQSPQGKPFYRWIEPPANAAQLNKALITGIGIDKANILITRANHYLAAGLEDSARREFDRALEVDPESEAVITRVAGLITGSGIARRCERVLEIASGYLSKHPGSDAVLVQRAKAKKCLGDLEGSFDDLIAALEVAPNSISYLSQLMNLPSREAKTAREFAIYQKVIDYLSARVAAEQTSRNISYLKSGLSNVFLGRSYAYGKLGNKDSQLSDMNSSVELWRENLAFRSRIYENYEMYDEAIADMTAYIAYLKSPENSRPQKNFEREFLIRASIFAKAGRISEAIADYERILETNPKSMSTQERINELRQKLPKNPQ